MMIICTDCGSEKPEDAFPVFKNGQNQGRRRKCRKCFAAASRMARAASGGIVPSVDPNEMRQCKRCTETRSILDFDTYRSGPNSVGHRRVCKFCYASALTSDQREHRRLRSLAWGRDNAEAARNRAAEWAAQNPERARANQARWRAENDERVKKNRRIWAEKNADKKKSLDAAWRAANKDRVAANIKAYRKANRDLEALWQHNRRARKKASGGTLTRADVEEIQRLQKGRCAYCKTRLGKSFHRDHIIPLVKGGAHDRKNIQLLCGPCNVSKSATHPIVFAQQRGLLL